MEKKSVKRISVVYVFIVAIFAIYSNEIIFNKQSLRLTPLDQFQWKRVDSFRSLLNGDFTPVVGSSEVIVPARKLRVAIIDTGVNFNHPLLAPFKSPLQKPEGSIDSHGHGTHVAGIVAQRLLEVFGKDASKYVEIISYKFHFFENEKFSLDKKDPLKMEVKKLKEANQDEVDFLNLSIFGMEYDQAEFDELKKLSNKGVKISVASGNAGMNANHVYPCSYTLENLQCVGSLDYKGDAVSSSNYGKKVTVWAYGQYEISTAYNFESHMSFMFLGGTSQAAPQVLSFEIITRLTTSKAARRMIIEKGMLSNAVEMPLKNVVAQEKGAL